jgi:thioredoxin 1
MTEVTFTDQNFEQEVLKSPLPVLVDFWAPWCGPCRVQGPIVEDLSAELDPAKAKVGKLNVDENPNTASAFNVLSIPSLIVFKGGQAVEQFVGVTAKDKLKSALEKHA